MFSGLGEAILSLFYVAVFGIVAVLTLIVGGILSLWWPISVGGLALAAIIAGLVTCLVIAAVYRP